MSTTSDHGNTVNVLFVDDEKEILNALRRQISLMDEFNGYFINNPLDVMNFLKEEEIQIIVADVVMPEQDGITLLQEVKTEFPNITRILLTAYGDYNTSLRAINDAEVFGFITKPWDQDYLFGHLRMARQMMVEHLNARIVSEKPFIVVAKWEDEHEIVELYHSTDDLLVASQFAKRVFLTSSALFGGRYRFQNNLFTLPLKESNTIVRGLLEEIDGENYGIFIFTNDFDSDQRRALDSIIYSIEGKLPDEFSSTYLQEIAKTL